jgi:Ca2+-binding RTX toxin-like protein
MAFRAPYDRRWYDQALLQIVAESYLDGIDDLADRPPIELRLLLGNNDLRDLVLVDGQPQPNQLLRLSGLTGREDPATIAILPGATRLTASQARYLLDRWQILDHVPNDPSGFSATLLRERATGQLTLAFRSTEYFPQNRGGDRERDIGGLFGAVSPLLDPAGAGPEIACHGFALGQLAAAERYYQRLRQGQLHVGGYSAEVASWFASAGNRLDLTGYSLGGHIALALTEIHYDEIGRTHLFNAAGRGEISDAIAGAGAPGGVALAKLLELFELLVADPDAYLTSPAFLPDVRAEIGRGILSDTLITLPPIAPFFGPISVPNSYRQLYEAAKAEVAPDAGRANLYQSDRYQWAAFALGLFTHGAAWATLAGPAGWGSSTIADPANKIVYLFGNGAHNDDSWVANSGRVPTGSRNWIFVEDQPDGFDSRSYQPAQEAPYRENDFGRTHSLTLIVDSLALANLIDEIDPRLVRSGDGQTAIDAIFAAASNSRAPHAGWLSGLEGIFDARLAGNPDYARTAVEADSLERVLDALWTLFRDEGDDAEPLAIDTSPHGFGHLVNRERFHERVVGVRDRLAALAGAANLEFRPLVQIDWVDATPAAKRILSGIGAPTAYRAAFAAFPESAQAIAEKAAEDSAEGYAYRYALRTLNPFVLLGFDYEGSYLNADGALDLRKNSGGVEYEQYTTTYLADRARLLLERLRRNVEDAGYLVTGDGQSELLEDLRLPPRALSTVSDPVAVLVGLEAQARLREIDDLGNAERNEDAARRMVQLVREGKATRTTFGAEGDDTLTGGSLADHLFGGAGDDTLDGRDGDDYLEAGTGVDRLLGGGGDDTLFALDGEPNDTLDGGRGFDTYYADFGDRIVDTPGDARAGVVHAGAGKMTLSGGSRTPDEAYFTGSDGLAYWLSGTGAIYVYADVAARGEPLVIAAPTAPVPGHETITLGDGTTAEILGRPDLGIPLVTLHARRPTPQIPAGFAEKVLRALTWIPRIDPLALDLDGDGFATIGNIGESTVRFDHDGNGVRNGTGWLAGDDDSWLVLDRDGDGLITRGAELFGIDTPLAGGGFARDGFEALAALDTNGDRVVDAYDRAYEAWQIARDADGDGVIARGETGGARFADLRLWHDANGNGVSEPFELRTLAEAGIVALNVGAVADGRALPGGNILRSTGTFVRADGSRGVAGALDLSRHSFFRDYERAPAFDPAVQGLPNVRGSGRVRDLVEAAAGSAELRSALARAAAAPTRAAQWVAVDAVIERWAATSDLPTSTVAFHARADAPIVMFPFSGIAATSVEAAFRAATSGLGFASGATPADLAPDWYVAQQSAAYRGRVAKIETIEAFYGQPLVDPTTPSFVAYSEWVPQGQGLPQKRYEIRAVGAPVDAVRWDFLEQAYSVLKEAVYSAIALQTRLAPYLDAISGGPQPFAAAEALLVARRAADPLEGLTDAVELARYAGAELVERGWTNLPLLVDRWGREALGDPVTQQALAELRVRTRDDLYLTGGPLGDTLLGSAWSPNFWTTAVPTISGEDGNDVILGGANDYYLFGGPGADVIYGGPGMEVVAGGPGRDVYLFGRGSGIDQAGFDYMSGTGALGSADRDVVRVLDGVAPSDILVRRISTGDFGGQTSDGLRLIIRGTDDVFIDPYFFVGGRTDHASRIVDEVRFSDGTLWNVATLRLLALEGTDGDDRGSPLPELRGYEDSDDVIDGRGGNDLIRGRGGDDVLYGGDGDDSLWGGPGDDRLFGGAGVDWLNGGAGSDYLDGGPGDDHIAGGYGVDVIRFGRGSGRDRLLDLYDPQDLGTGRLLAPADADIIELDADVSPADVRIINTRGYSTPEHLRVWIEGADAELIDEGFGRNQVNYYGAVVSSILELHFASGEVWDEEVLKTRSLIGSAASEIIVGYDGRGDYLAGHGGDDELHGLGGDDVLNGGPGDDTLYGGAGNDTYRFGRSQGRDRIIDTDPTPGNVDRIELGPDLTPADVRLRRVDSNLQLLTPLADTSLTVLGWFSSPAARVERVDFADGTSWEAELLARTPRFGEPGVNDAIVVPTVGDDYYLFGRGFGRDVIYENASGIEPGSFDTVIMAPGIEPQDVSLSRTDNDLVLSIVGTSDRLTLAYWFEDPVYEVERVEFANGRVWNVDYLRALGAIPNRAPTLTATLPGQQAAEGVPFRFVLPAGTFADEDPGDVLALSAALEGGGPLPTWLAFDPVAQAFEGTPGRGDTGTLRIEVRATDDAGASSTGAFEIVVAPSNRPPVLRGLTAATDEDAPLSLSREAVLATAEDADGDALAVVRVWGAANGTVALDAQQTIVFVPLPDYAGPARFDYAVSDGVAETAGTAWIDVRPVNDPPVAHAALLESQTAIEDMPFRYRLPAGLFTDVDATEPLRLTLGLADGAPLPAWLAFDEAASELAGTPGYADGGAIRLRASASDGQATAVAEFPLTVVVTSIVGSSTNNRLVGTAAADKLVGLAGADTLDGRGGADTMIGGPGNDTYHVDDPGDRVIEAPDEGTDRVVATIDYALPAHVENLTLSGAAGTGIGNDLANSIVGNALANSLWGGDGDDTLNGALGADRMAGGPGNDRYYVDDPGDLVVEAPDEGTDRIFASIDYALPDHVENLTLQGSAVTGRGNAAANSILGNALDNRLYGGDGDDTLNGGAGADWMEGGRGSDSYHVDDPGDRVWEAFDEGTDRVYSSIDYALPSHVENLTLQAGARIGMGNAAANSITGNAGANYLAGGAGADSLSGGQGDDVLQGGDDNDALSTAGGSNLLDGGAGADSLAGGTGSDLLIGGRGNDALRPKDGANLIAFNRGDGQDTLYSLGGATNALSLGGGIAYEDVKLQKSSNHLVVHLGNGEKITLNGWYQDPNLRTLVQLQFVAEAMAGFAAGGGDPLRDERIERFDFRPIAAAYDAGRAGGYAGQWAIMDALLAAHLAGSDDEALGGDLAYRYGMTGSLSDIGLAAAQSILAEPGFGTSPQALRPTAELGADPVRLAG